MLYGSLNPNLATEVKFQGPTDSLSNLLSYPGGQIFPLVGQTWQASSHTRWLSRTWVPHPGALSWHGAPTWHATIIGEEEGEEGASVVAWSATAAWSHRLGGRRGQVPSLECRPGLRVGRGRAGAVRQILRWRRRWREGRRGW